MKTLKIIAIISVVLFVWGSFYGVLGACNTVTLEKEVSAVRLTLSDNTVLYDIRLEKKVNDISVVTEDMVKKCNVIFIVDTDSSAEPELSNIKSNLKDFSNQLYSDTYYSKAENKLHLGFLAMDNSESNKNPADLLEIDLENKTKDTYESDIENIEDDKYNAMDALTIATNSLDEFDANNGAGNDEMMQAIIFITDGVDDANIDESKAMIEDLIDNMMVLVYGIVVGDDPVIDRLFETPYMTLLKTTQWLEVKSFLDYNIKNDIQLRAVNNSLIIPQGVTDGALVLPNEIQLYLDQEIMHGALLEIEYVIRSTSVSYVGAAITTTIMDRYAEEDFKYDPDKRLITKSGTNKDEGWQIDTVTNALICNPDSDGEVRIVLSTTLSNEKFNDEGYINRVESLTSTQGVNVASSATSMRVKIVPPFGKEEKNAYMPTILVGVAILLLMFGIVKIKNNRKRKNGI